MRDAFIAELLAVARRDPDVMLVVGDLGFGVVDTFARELPQQFLNAGVAEQNMVGMAAGLASGGYKVFVYSIANFPTLRAVEQIRNDVCYHGLDVTVVSVGAGVSYGTLGYTHHAVEDLAILRALPGMRVMCPADPLEAEAAVHECLEVRGPTYVRLGKNGEPPLHEARPASLAQPLLLCTGSDVVIAGVGAIVSECLQAAQELRTCGIAAGVWSCPTVAPLDATNLLKGTSGTLVTVEEHSLPGGFGSAVLEFLNDEALSRPVLRLGLDSELKSEIGSHSYLRKRHGLDAETITRRVLECVSRDGTG